MSLISLKSLMNNNAPAYSPEVVQPFREELTVVGFKELLSPADVDAALNSQDNKIILVVLNSVCGCAAGKARPGVILLHLPSIILHRAWLCRQRIRKQNLILPGWFYHSGCLMQHLHQQV